MSLATIDLQRTVQVAPGLWWTKATAANLDGLNAHGLIYSYEPSWRIQGLEIIATGIQQATPTNIDRAFCRVSMIHDASDDALAEVTVKQRGPLTTDEGVVTMGFSVPEDSLRLFPEVIKGRHIHVATSEVDYNSPAMADFVIYVIVQDL